MTLAGSGEAVNWLTRTLCETRTLVKALGGASGLVCTVSNRHPVD